MIRGLKLILFFFAFCSFNQISFSKPLPPGSGSGDVPANILFLLDSSASMNRTIGAGIPRISSMTIDGDGNKFLTSVDRRGGGLFKFNSDGERVNTYQELQIMAPLTLFGHGEQLMQLIELVILVYQLWVVYRQM